MRTSVALDVLEELSTLAGERALTPDLARQALEELSSALEELSVAGEELGATNDELLAAQEGLRSGRRAYEELFDFAPDGLLVTDGYGRVLEANLAARRLLGIGLSALRGKPMAVLVSPEDRSGFFRALERLRRTGARTEWEGGLAPRDRAVFPAVMAGVPRPNAREGEAARLLWTLHDFSERRAFESALRDRERTFRTLCEHSPDLIARVGSNLRVSYANPAFGALLGRTPAALTGLDVRALVADPDDAGLPAACRRALGEGEQRVEVALRRHDGATCWFESRIVPEPGEPGEPGQSGQSGGAERLLLLFRDVTERRAAERVAHQRDELKSAMLARVSHELRTPLTAIVAAAEALAQRNLDAEGDELAALIGGESLRLERMVANLLDLSRLEGGALEARAEPYPLDTLVSSALAAAGAALDGAQVDVNVDESVGLVMADPLLSERILVNLLHNAVTHGRPPLRVEALRADGHVEVAVSDAGPGIPAAHTEEIFRPFASAGARGGAGIGLALARALAQAQSAALRLETPPGGGCRFVLRLPAAELVDELAPPPSARADVSMRVLVVDDEPQIVRALSSSLSAAGYEVASAGTAAAGLRAAALEPPDAVVLDLRLPDGDGLEVCRRLREWSQVPVVVVSAVGDESMKVAALDAGADDYVTKPYSTGELLARLRAVMRRAAAPDESPVVQVGELTIDLGRREVRRGDEAIRLTRREYGLLAELARHAGRLVTHAALLRAVWGPGAQAQTHYLHVHMSTLRRKLERDPARPQHLVTEIGVGYRLRTEQ